MIKVLPCKHKYCIDCIKKQIHVFSSRCSLCRVEIDRIIGPESEDIDVKQLEFNFDPNYAWTHSLCYICGTDEGEV